MARRNREMRERDEKVRFGFAGNAVEKTVKVPDDQARPWDLDTEFHVVGKHLPRLDALAKASGRAKYAYDMNLPGMLHARFLRTTIASGVVESVDASTAEKLAGVKAVEVIAKAGTPVLFAGEAVAVVCAETPEICDDAVREIFVAYEATPHVVTADEAKETAAPIVHGRSQSQRNPLRETNRSRPRVQGASPEEVDAALGRADVRIDVEYRTQVQTHSALETHGCVAHWKKSDSGEDQLTVWASTQGTFSVRDELCERFGLDRSQVEVICEYMGGGFGAKFGAGEEGYWAAALSRKTGKPVKLMLTRKEEHLCTGNRPDSVQQVRAGAAKDGSLVAWSVVNWGTGGISASAGCRNPMIYVQPEHTFRKEEFGVAINAGPEAAMRAPGHPQAAFGVEQAMDELANSLGMDPIEFRLKNDRYPMRAAQYEIAKELIGWGRRNPRDGEGPLAGGGALRRGLGVGAATWANNGRGNTTGIRVVITGDGGVEVRSGCQDIGTGTRTIVGMCVAETLGCPMERVRVRMGHTSDPFGPASGGSVTAPTVAPAARDAGHAAKRALVEHVAERMKLAADDLDIRGGTMTSRSDASKRWGWDEVCKQIGVEAIDVTQRRQDNFREGFSSTVGGVQIAEVEVDTETGVVRPIKIVAVHDAGTVVNRLTFESQIVGGVIQGLAYALHEDRVMDRKTGQMLNTNLESYKIPGSTDMPEIVARSFDLSNGYNSAGVAGLGEPTVIPTAGAVANAVANATGARVRSLPMTPRRVLAALAERTAAKNGGAK